MFLLETWRDVANTTRWGDRDESAVGILALAAMMPLALFLDIVTLPLASLWVAARIVSRQARRRKK